VPLRGKSSVMSAHEWASCRVTPVTKEQNAMHELGGRSTKTVYRVARYVNDVPWSNGGGLW